MEIKFKNIKEMDREVKALNNDKNKLESRCMQSTMLEQIRLIQEKRAKVLEDLESLDLDILYKKNENLFNLQIIRCDMKKDQGNRGYGWECCCPGRISIEIEYIATYEKPMHEVVHGTMIFDNYRVMENENMMQLATRMVSEKLK